MNKSQSPFYSPAATSISKRESEKMRTELTKKKETPKKTENVYFARI
jgi:hypothetical protein